MSPVFVYFSEISQSSLLICCCTCLVNTSRAGEGSLDIAVSSGGENVPHTTKGLGNGTFDVSFTPHRAEIHLVVIKFNGEMVSGNSHRTNILMSVC